jgi:hypothetical protein
MSENKISIAKKIGVDDKEVYESIVCFYKFLAKCDSVVDAIELFKEEVGETSKILDYFSVIGIIEFTKRFYGSSDEFKFKW